MEQFFQQALAWIGGAAIGSVSLVAVAYWLFQTLGEKWLQSQFDRQLEDLRHVQGQEMEGLRYRIGQLLDRSTKLSEKEFEVVPEAWQKLVDAYHTTRAHVSSAKQRPAVERMNDEQLEEFLAGSELHESQKAEIRNTPSVDRGSTYYKAIYWHEKAHAEQTARAFSGYLAKYGIFISNKAIFSQLEDMIWDALSEYSMFFEYETRERKDVRKLEKEGAVLKDQLEAEIHGRLWNTDLSTEQNLSNKQSWP